MIQAGVAPREALPLFREARSLLDRSLGIDSTERREAVQSVIEGLEALAPHLRDSDASRYLDHWARELLNGHSTTAAVHLDRAALALGIRPSDVRRAPANDETLVSLRVPKPEPAAAPVVVEPEPLVALPPPVVATPAPVVAAPAPVVAAPAPEPVVVEPEPVVVEPEPGVVDPRLACLSPEEQALVGKLPLEGEPLKGADALARCWGERMSPTSARGRYSRLANKLKEQHGRDLLLRGRGRYARLG